MIKLTRHPCPNPAALAKRNYKEEKNKRALRLSSHDKCMYCESKVSHTSFGDVEHIKPKDVNQFPHLEFEWSNLGYVCSVCNNAKSNKYYVAAPFIDPYNEDPSEHLIAFGSLLHQKNGSQRGELTIKEIKLNRLELVERRFERIQDLQKAIDACNRTTIAALRADAIKLLQTEAEPSKEFSLFAQALLSAHKR